MATGAVPISIGATVDIGGGRGRLAPNPAASLRRIDAQLGRLADVNDAWRSPEVADANRAAWIAYQGGYGPVAPYALDRWGSIHCRGYATDSDDWYSDAAAAVWRRNGWRQTALYPVGDSRREPWHGEYDEALDLYLGTTAAGGSTDFPEDDMFNDADRQLLDNIAAHLFAGGTDAAKPEYLGAKGSIYNLLKTPVDRGADGKIPQIQELADSKTILMRLEKVIARLPEATAALILAEIESLEAEEGKAPSADPKA